AKLLQSAFSVRNSCALQLLAVTWPVRKGRAQTKRSTGAKICGSPRDTSAEERHGIKPKSRQKRHGGFASGRIHACSGWDLPSASSLRSNCAGILAGQTADGRDQQR